MGFQFLRFFRRLVRIFPGQVLQHGQRDHAGNIVVRPATHAFQPGIATTVQFLPVIQPGPLTGWYKPRQVPDHAPVTLRHGQLNPVPRKAFRDTIILYQPGKYRVTLVRLGVGHGPQFLYFGKNTVGLFQDDLPTRTLTPQDGVGHIFGIHHQVHPAAFLCQRLQPGRAQTRCKRPAPV